MRPDAVEQPLEITALEETTVSLKCQFNPLGLRWAGSAVWAKHRPVGWTGERVQFLGNPNETRSLELFFAATDETKFETLDFARKFLQSLIRPPANPGSIAKNAPPDVMLVWPNNLAIVCKVESFSAFDSQMQTDGKTIRHTTTLNLFEIYMERLTSDVVREQGMQRAAVTI